MNLNVPADIKVLLDFTLGDGYIGIKREKSDYHSFRVEHSIKQVEYAKHKQSVLESFGYKVIAREIVSNNPKTPGFRYYRVDIHNDPRLRTARKYLYNKRIKTIDKHLLRSMDVESFAYFFMDDGCAKTVQYSLSAKSKIVYNSRKVHSYKLSMNCFTEDEVILFRDWIKESFDIEFSIKCPKNYGYFLEAAKIAEKDKLKTLLLPYVKYGMEYKLSYPHSFIGIPYKVFPRYKSAVETERNDSSNLEDDATVQE